MLEQALVEGITKIANSEKVVKYLEPGVFTHTTITEFMTQRVLYSLSLLLELHLKGKK